MDWNDCPGNAGIGKERPADKARAQHDQTALPPRKKPAVLLKAKHNRMHEFASQGVEMSSQGVSYETLQGTVHYLQSRNDKLCKKVLKYKERFGDLSDESGKSVLVDLDQFLQSPMPTLDSNIPTNLDDV